MRHKQRKEFATLLTLLSILFMFLPASFLAHPKAPAAVTYPVMILAIIMAAIAALVTIVTSRHLQHERGTHRLFLIYAREDLQLARWLADQLRKRGFNPWLDVDEIAPGQVWRKAVMNALEESVAALVLVTKHLAKKGFVQEELKAALAVLEGEREDLSPVVPVQLDDSDIPEALEHIQSVNPLEGDGMERLVSGLRRLIEGNGNSPAPEPGAE